MTSVRRILGVGLATMGAVGVVTAIWPSVAGLVTDVLVTVVCVGVGALAVLGWRWVRAEVAWRRELRSMPPLDTVPYGMPSPGLAHLQESA